EKSMASAVTLASFLSIKTSWSTNPVTIMWCAVAAPTLPIPMIPIFLVMAIFPPVLSNEETHPVGHQLSASLSWKLFERLNPTSRGWTVTVLDVDQFVIELSRDWTSLFFI